MHANSASSRVPLARLTLWLLAAGVGLGLFFAGEYRDLPLPLGWFGTFLFVAAVWFAFGTVADRAKDEGELEVAAAEWQAWVGTAFLAVIIALLVSTLPLFNQPLPIQGNSELRGVGSKVGGWFVAWALLAYALQLRWQAHTLEDEFDRHIQNTAQSWGYTATAFLIISMAITLGFSEPSRLANYSYAFMAHLLMLTLLLGWLVQQLLVALLYGRERRATRRAA